MEKLKKLLNEIFINGLSGMATGLFATLIIGTIIQQVGNLIPGAAGTYLFMIGKIAAAVTGAGIGCGTAVKLKAGPLVMLSAAAVGMTGAFAGKIIEGAVLVENDLFFRAGGASGGVYRRSGRHLCGTAGVRKDESGYFSDALCLYCIGGIGRAGARAADFRFYGVAWVCH